MTSWLAPWILIGVVTAVTLSMRAYLQKRLSPGNTSLELAFISSAVAAVAALPFGLHALAGGTVPAPPVMAGVLFVAAMNGGGLYLFFRALHVEDLSVASPIRQTMPVFVAVIEPLVLAQAFRPVVLGGAVLAAAGGYLTVAEGRHPLEPLARLQEEGPLFALASAVLLALGAVGVKYVVSHIPALLFVSLLFLVMTLIFGVVLHRTGSVPRWQVVAERRYVLLGLVTLVSQVLIFITIDLSTAAQATILFRVSIPLNLLLGYHFLREGYLGYRLAGGALIIAGVALAV